MFSLYSLMNFQDLGRWFSSIPEGIPDGRLAFFVAHDRHIDFLKSVPKLATRA